MGFIFGIMFLAACAAIVKIGFFDDEETSADPEIVCLVVQADGTRDIVDCEEEDERDPQWRLDLRG